MQVDHPVDLFFCLFHQVTIPGIRFTVKCRTQKSPAGCRAGSGDKEIRTLDPLLAKQVLYQLSYTPKSDCKYRHNFLICNQDKSR